MANKRNAPKPGSTWKGLPWQQRFDDENTFRDMCDNLQKKDSGSQAARGELPRFTHSMGKKAKTTMVYAYTGNEGKSAQLPMQKRKVNVLKFLQIAAGKVYVKDIEPGVLKALIADGDVYIENGKSNHIRQSHSYAVPTERADSVPVKPEVIDEIEMPATKTIMWTKDLDHKLLIDIIKGTADQDLIDAVGKTKTKMRKITVRRDFK